MKRVVCLALLLSLLLCGCSWMEEYRWQAGQKALAEGKYSEAVSAFEKAGSYQDAQRLLQYAKAWQSLENGEYTQADSTFRALGSFKDSSLMSIYCQAREQEALAQEAFTSENTSSAIRADSEAVALYTGLSLFRDSDTRAANCRERLYTQATEWMNLGRCEEAASGFEALGNYQDSGSLQKYCRASILEKQADYAGAADLYAEIPGVLDADTKAEAARGQAYQQALDLKERGDYEAASKAFDALGSYRDSEEQRDSATVLQIRTLIRAGSFEEALRKMTLLDDLTVFPEADPSGTGNPEAFLKSFLNTWMNAHARVMNAFFSCNLLQSYVESGGELDTRIRAEITDDGTPLNYGFIFYGAETEKLLALDEGFTAAKVHGSASYTEAGVYKEVEENLWVLMDSSRGNPLVAAVLPVS